MTFRTHEFNANDNRDLLDRSVGPKMTNRPEDIYKVEDLLYRAGYPPFDPETGPTGMSGPVLDRATMEFQKANGLRPDGMIYTDGPTIKALARQGRNGDSEIAHLTPGETVVPERAMTPELRRELDKAFDDKGFDKGRYTVGGNDDSINPKTGMREFADRRRRKEDPRGGLFDDGPRGEKAWVQAKDAAIDGATSALNKFIGGILRTAPGKYGPGLKGIYDAQREFFDRNIDRNRK